jgi:hypothetical protein
VPPLAAQPARRPAGSPSAVQPARRPPSSRLAVQPARRPPSAVQPARRPPSAVRRPAVSHVCRVKEFGRKFCLSAAKFLQSTTEEATCRFVFGNE